MPDPDADEPDEVEVYEFASTGGCARCDAMAGYHYTFEPSRPHYKCQCHVKQVFRPGSIPPSPRITREGFQSEHPPGAYPDGSFYIHHTALIECPDGSDHSVEIITETSYRDYEASLDDPDDMKSWYDREIEHVMEDLRELADDLCGPPLVG